MKKVSTDSISNRTFGVLELSIFKLAKLSDHRKHTSKKNI